MNTETPTIPSAASPSEAPEKPDPQAPSDPPVDTHKGPSILYAGPMNVLDITSGAALSMRTLLSALTTRGFRSVALQATLFDSEHGAEHVLKASEALKDKSILRSQVLGVEHLIVRTGHVRRPNMTSKEEEIFIRRFRDELKHRRPDMIILWGSLLLEMTVMREAREAGVPVVFYLVNAGYERKEAFQYASVIVTDTQATARHYKEKMDLDCVPIGKFIDPGLVKAKERKPEFITFINPSFEKGVNLFLPLAKMAARECPEIKFLVVQSRGRWGNALKVLKFDANDFPNVRIIGHQKDMRPVYAATKALLLPSTWHESGARVIPEALINGIPVLASNTGGSAELVGAGGVIFDLPAVVMEKKTEAATEEAARPWLEEIKRVWHDPAYYATLCTRVEKEAEQHGIVRNTERFLMAVTPAVRASKGLAPLQPRPLQPRPVPAHDVQGAVKQALARKQQKKAKRR